MVERISSLSFRNSGIFYDRVSAYRASKISADVLTCFMIPFHMDARWFIITAVSLDHSMIRLIWQTELVLLEYLLQRWLLFYFGGVSFARYSLSDRKCDKKSMQINSRMSRLTNLKGKGLI